MLDDGPSCMRHNWKRRETHNDPNVSDNLDLTVRQPITHPSLVRLRVDGSTGDPNLWWNLGLSLLLCKFLKQSVVALQYAVQYINL